MIISNASQPTVKPIEPNNLKMSLEYAKRGIRVFPLCWPDVNGNCGCGRNHIGRDIGKVPLTEHGLKDGNIDVNKIKHWWTMWPKANIGLVCGHASSFFVVDVDAHSGGIDSLNGLENKYGKLDTLKITTGGGGYHFYFKYPPDEIEIRNKPNIGGYQGVETRGEGGYVVAPPSLHRTGKRYGFADQREIKEAPGWLINMVRVPNRPTNSSADAGMISSIPEGSRNNTLISMAGVMTRKGFPESAIYAALVETNNKQCNPPLAETEIRKIVKSATRYAPEKTIFNNNLTTQTQLEWETPLPFVKNTGEPFPIDVLPQTVKNFVEAQSTALQVPADLVASMVIGVGAAASSGRCTIRINQEWIEPLNLFIVTALPSGERKSPVVRVVTSPLEERERSLAETHRPEIETQKSEREVLEAQLQAAKTKAAKAGARDRKGKEMAEVISLSEELANFHLQKTPRLLADDATSEAVTTLLSENEGRIAIMSTEGGLFETLAGRYSEHIPNIDVYLKGYSGDPIRVDRKSRAPEFIRKPALTLCLTVQPDVIGDLMLSKIFRGRGLLARFLYSLPHSMVGYRSTMTVLVPEELRKQWRQIIMNILKLPDMLDGHEHEIKLSTAADGIFQQFRAEAEKRLRPEGDLSGIADWGNKFPGNVARIAGILHLFCHSENGQPWDILISKSTIQAAIAIGNYYLEHALVAFQLMGTDPNVDKARRLWAIIKSQRHGRFSQRELHQSLRRTFTSADIAAALNTLSILGYVQLISSGISGKAGRHASPIFEVNPLACTQNTQNTQNTAGLTNSVDSENSEYTQGNQVPLTSNNSIGSKNSIKTNTGDPNNNEGDQVSSVDDKDWGAVECI